MLGKNDEAGLAGVVARLVIKDAAKYEAAWAERANGAGGAPRVDFGRQMVIAAFGGGGSGCDGMGIRDIQRGNGKIIVDLVHTHAAPDSMLACTMAFTVPAVWVAIDKSDEPVEFVSQTRYYR